MDALVKQRGMTLIEVMVAAVILALVMLGVMAVASHTQKSTLRLNQTTQATWVANAVSAQIRAGVHGEMTQTGSLQGTYDLGGVNWYWQAKAKPLANNVAEVTLTIQQEKGSVAIVTLTTGMWVPA